MSVFIGENSNGEKIVHITADEYDLDTVMNKITPTTIFHSSLKNIHEVIKFTYNFTKDDLKYNGCYSDDKYQYNIAVPINEDSLLGSPADWLSGGNKFYIKISIEADLTEDDIDNIASVMSNKDSKDINVWALFYYEEEDGDVTYCSDPDGFIRNNVFFGRRRGKFQEIYTSMFDLKMESEDDQFISASVPYCFTDAETLCDSTIISHTYTDECKYLILRGFTQDYITLTLFHIFLTKSLDANITVDIGFLNIITNDEIIIQDNNIDLKTSEIEISSDKFNIIDEDGNEIIMYRDKYLTKSTDCVEINNYVKNITSNSQGTWLYEIPSILNPYYNNPTIFFTSEYLNINPFFVSKYGNNFFSISDRTLSVYNDDYSYELLICGKLYQLIDFNDNADNIELDLYNNRLRLTIGTSLLDYFNGSKNKNCIVSKATDIYEYTIPDYETPDYDHKVTILNFGSTYIWYGTDDYGDIIDIGYVDNVELTNISNDDFNSFFIAVSLFDGNGSYHGYGDLGDISSSKYVKILSMEHNKSLYAKFEKNDDGTYKIYFSLIFKYSFFSTNSNLTKDDIYENISGYKIKFMLL